MQLGYPNPLRDIYLSLTRRDQGRMRERFARGIRRFRSGPCLPRPRVRLGGRGAKVAHLPSRGPT